MRVFFKHCTHIKYLDLQKVPLDKGCIIVSNHESYYDPFAIGTVFDKKIHYMAKEELFQGIQTGFLRMMCAFPVKRDEVEMKVLKHSLGILKKGDFLGIFPEGTRNPDGDIKSGKRGAATISIMSECPVVPAAIVGGNNCLIRKFPPKWKNMIVKYGDPIYPQDFTGSKKDRITHMTDAIMDKIRTIKKELEETWEQ